MVLKISAEVVLVRNLAGRDLWVPIRAKGKIKEISPWGNLFLVEFPQGARWCWEGELG